MEVHEARNFVLLSAVLLENFHVFNCRSERVSAFRVTLKHNPLLIDEVLVAQSVHIRVMPWPFMQRELGVAQINFSNRLNMLGLAGC